MVFVNGTNENDVFTVTVNTITITGRATVVTTAIPRAALNGFEGNDSFFINGDNTYVAIVTDGGDGDDDDVLNLFNNAAAATIDLGLSLVTGYGGVVSDLEFRRSMPMPTAKTCW